MLKIVLVTVLFCASSVAPALAGQPVASFELAQTSQNPPNSHSDRPGWRPGVREQNYYCVIEGNSDSGRNFCSARPGRVGETCRCPNMTGTGRLQAR